MTLHVLDRVPDRLLDLPARSVAEVLPGLTLIHLEGQRRPALEGVWSSVPTSGCS